MNRKRGQDSYLTSLAPLLASRRCWEIADIGGKLALVRGARDRVIASEKRPSVPNVNVMSARWDGKTDERQS